MFPINFISAHDPVIDFHKQKSTQQMNILSLISIQNCFQYEIGFLSEV